MKSLETKTGFLARVKEIYAKMDHYLDDLAAYLMGERPMHHHDKSHTIRSNHVIHSYFYYEGRVSPWNHVVNMGSVRDLED